MSQREEHLLDIARSGSPSDRARVPIFKANSKPQGMKTSADKAEPKHTGRMQVARAQGRTRPAALRVKDTQPPKGEKEKPAASTGPEPAQKAPEQSRCAQQRQATQQRPARSTSSLPAPRGEPQRTCTYPGQTPRRCVPGLRESFRLDQGTSCPCTHGWLCRLTGLVASGTLVVGDSGGDRAG